MSSLKFLKMNFHWSLHFLSHPHRTLFPILPFLPYKSLQFYRYHSSSSSAAIDALTSDSTRTPNSLHQDHHHPWPEWVAFVDRLKTKGYFTANVRDDVADTSCVYRDINQLKDPCLSFARDRYDLLKLLSVADIQRLVGNGCPNLLRKAVNSAKRLRAYAGLDEGDVCSTCYLRGSCDRAYVILEGNESGARTVDVVRLLLFYALDPLVISGEQKPPGREGVEAAVKKLLSELLELSQRTPDPPTLKPAAKLVHQKEQERRFDDDNQSPLSGIFSDEKLSQDVEMKRGDWMCPKCNFMNFSRNISCLKCKEEGPKNVRMVYSEMKKGDWICSKCDFLNFSRNTSCLKCKSEGPERVDTNVEMKKGDWNCTECRFMNYAARKMCLRCRGPRPQRHLNPGAWECPSCDFLNFSRNIRCERCNGERPNEEAKSEHEEQVWRNPH